MLRIIGAGLPRTATMSLKTALPTLLGGPCYHMRELFAHPDDMDHWLKAVDGETVDWAVFFEDYAAAADWPASAFWPRLAEVYPDALILLSTRTSGRAWWKSMDATVMAVLRQEALIEETTPFLAMITGLWRQAFGEDPVDDPEHGAEFYERYVQHVRDTAPPDRLLEWNATQGWEPICAALGVDVPEEPFPHVNTTEEWLARFAETGGPPRDGIGPEFIRRGPS